MTPRKQNPEKHEILFLPGPVEVDPELRAIMAMPLVGHRSRAFLAKVASVCEKLKALFGTRAHALFETCPATALMEAAVRNLAPKRVLHLTCGAFGARWAEISRACGSEVSRLSVEWGKANLAESLEQELRRNAYDAVMITHNETSTGVLNPLAELAATVRRVAADTLICVDAVSSLAGAELRFDDWGLDLAFAGTQKCLALPPGLCVFALSERALQRAAHTPERGYLLDFARAERSLAAGRTVATPCVPLVFALSRQLERITEEGLEPRWQRHSELRSIVADWAPLHGHSLFAEAPHRSPTVTTLRDAQGNPDRLCARAAAAGFRLGSGYGKLKGTTIRIGHMGDHRPERLRALLQALA